MVDVQGRILPVPKLQYGGRVRTIYVTLLHSQLRHWLTVMAPSVGDVFIDSCIDIYMSLLRVE